MAYYGWPILYALFVWWFSTGAIIYLDGLPRNTFRWSMLGATVVLALSLFVLSQTAADTSVFGAYAAFTAGLLAWGWQEISFYTGFVTGPRKGRCPDGCSGWPHFVHAIQTSLWHELAIIAAAVAVVALTWDAPNQVGTWTFMVLWWMHQSAKLNVFLGVRNLNEEFLPDHLDFLKGFLTKKPMNLLFPVSVTVSTVIAVYLAEAAWTAALPAERVGFTFLAFLMALAILEHWFLVLALPSAKLWHWGLASRQPEQPFDLEIATGFLGAGKTTYLRRRLAALDPATRTVALVNDFGELGVDASLLRGRGADVVELPNGCICCTLKKDLATQLKEAVSRFRPERILIEPSGVADTAALLTVLDDPLLRPLVRSLHMTALVDAGAFLSDYARNSEHFEAQARIAPRFLINKSDLVSAAELHTVRDTLLAINPGATAEAAVHGAAIDWPALPAAESGERPARPSAPVLRLVSPPARSNLEPRPYDQAGGHHGQRTDHGPHEHVTHGTAGHRHDHASHDPASPNYPHQHTRSEEALGFQSWSTRLDGHADQALLRRALSRVAAGAYGEVVRLKGVAPSGEGWLRFDIAGGRVAVAAFAPGAGEAARVMAIGRDMETVGLGAELDGAFAPERARDSDIGLTDPAAMAVPAE